MNARGGIQLAALFSCFVVFLGIGWLWSGATVHVVYRRVCTCPPVDTSDASLHQSDCALRPGKGGGFRVRKRPPSDGKARLLSYQPPGNGWNNQRIVLENALVLAKLLNRTLVVHPMSPHRLGESLEVKDGRRPGYAAYNLINTSDLLPLSEFVDLELMAQLVPIVSVDTAHPKFLRDYSSYTWKNVCHSIGFGYWVDRLPQDKSEVDLLTRQRFTPLRAWRKKCPDELARAKKDPSPIVRYVSDLFDDEAEMIYFEHGTLFGMHIRFTTKQMAMEAEKWVTQHIRYRRKVWDKVDHIAKLMGPYNAIHVRRNDHMDRRLDQSYWINRMIERHLSKALPLFIATDEQNAEWFLPFKDAGFRVYFTSNFSHILDVSKFTTSLQEDVLGIHEQCLCVRAAQYIASPASTFDAFVLRNRGEVKKRDGIMTDTLHTFWLGHQTTS